MKITVGIPTLNGHERLDRCLTSIADHTNLTEIAAMPAQIKVIVCDDASTEDNLKLNKDAIHRAERLRVGAGLEMMINPDRRGISRSWNQLARHGDSDFVVLLNDDVEVVPHWLDVVIYSLAHNPRLGMVGLNAYVGVTRDAVSATHAGYPAHVARPRIDYIEANLLTGGGQLLASIGSAFGMRRAAFDEVGGFDERYFCFYEELSMGVDLRTRGYFHAIASYPIIYHQGGATTSKMENLDAGARINQSRQLFLDKWLRTPEQIREWLGPAQIPELKEWNTQIANWR